MRLRKKYLKCKEGTAKDVMKIGVNTCILKIEIIATSKIEDHFIYDVCYLDEGEIKNIPIIAKNVIHAIDMLRPYVRKGISENVTQFKVGATEESIISRNKNLN